MDIFSCCTTKEERTIYVIGNPTNVKHDIHVIQTETGTLEGMPILWQRFMDSPITKDELSKNPYKPIKPTTILLDQDK